MAYIEEAEGVHYDGLIGGTSVPVFTKNVTILAAAAETAYKRGLVLSLKDGKYEPLAKGGTANAILADDVKIGAEDVVATVYTKGEFNREKLILPEEDTAEAHEEELRDFGIYLTSIH